MLWCMAGRPGSSSATAALSNTREEHLVEARLTVDLGMEAGAEKRPLLHCDDPTVGQRGEHVDRGPHPLDDRSTDEGRVHGGSPSIGTSSGISKDSV